MVPRGGNPCGGVCGHRLRGMQEDEEIDGTKAQEMPRMMWRAIKTQHRDTDAPSTVMSASAGATRNGAEDLSRETIEPNSVHFDPETEPAFVASTDERTSFELSLEPGSMSVANIVNDVIPNETRQLTQTSKDSGVSATSNAQVLAQHDQQSNNQYAPSATSSVFDSIMLTLGQSNQIYHGGLRDKSAILAQSRPVPATQEDEKIEPALLSTVTANAAVPSENEIQAQHTPAKALVSHDKGTDPETMTANGVVTSGTLQLRNPAASAASHRYSSSLLSERLPPQQQEPVEDFCTFCRQVCTFVRESVEVGFGRACPRCCCA